MRLKRFRGADTIPLGLSLFSLQHEEEIRASGCSNGLYRDAGKPLSNQLLDSAVSTTVTQGTLKIWQITTVPSVQEKSILLEKFQQDAIGLIPPLGRFCRCKLTPAWRSYSLRTCTVPPGDPCTPGNSRHSGKLSKSLSWSRDNGFGLGIAMIFTVLNLIDDQDLFCLFF